MPHDDDVVMSLHSSFQITCRRTHSIPKARRGFAVHVIAAIPYRSNEQGPHKDRQPNAAGHALAYLGLVSAHP